MSRLLEVAGLQAFYGEAQILFGLDFHVDEGEVVGLVGRNGAGKSTTLKALMGLVARTAGEIRFGGESIVRRAPFRIARLGLGLVPEDRRIFSDLSVAENLDIGRRSGPGAPASPRFTLKSVERLFPALGPLMHRGAGQLSGGEQQMLSIARTLMGNPRLLLLDEPTEGLAPLIVEDLIRSVRAICDEGVSVLVCEQNAAFATALIQRGYLLAEGHIRASGAWPALVAAQAAEFEAAAQFKAR